MRDPKGPLKLLVFSGSVLALCIAWSAWAGVRLRVVRKQAEAESMRLDSVHEAMADETFRAELKEALEAKRQDSQPFRQRLADLARKCGIVLDGSITEGSPVPIPRLGLTQVDFSLAFKDVSMEHFLDYACAIEMQIPDAVVTDAALKPIPSAGNRWEVRLKVSKRQKLSP